MASPDGAGVSGLGVCEVLANCRATIAGATIEISHVTIVGAEIANGESLTLTACLNRAAAICVGEHEGLLVGVHFTTNGSCRIGGALGVDDTAVAAQERVDATVVGVRPSILALCTGLDLSLDI